jgi:hypothetical protein
MLKRIALVLSAATACAESSTTDLADAVINCEFGRATTLAVGQVLTASSSARFCIESSSRADFVLIPFVAGARDTAARVTVSIHGAGLGPAPSSQQLQRNAPAPRAPGPAAPAVMLRQLHEAGHAALSAQHAKSTRLLAPHTRSIRMPNAPAPSARAVPSPGDVILLNVSGSCTEPDPRSARVIAVTQRAIVAYDQDNPAADPFTTEDLQRFGREFDETIYPTLTQNFGSPTDLDQNGRVILYFTRAVNEIVPGGSRTNLVIGFFFRGDVFPRAGIPGRAEPCPAGNEGEVLFLSVPDPEGEVRGFPINHSTLEQVMTGTIAHELQHLINSARRIHITNAPALEETWLNEALSYIAEELMFYAFSGLTPQLNVDTTSILQSEQRRDAFNRFGYFNLGRFDRFLQNANDWSPIGPDGQETRGSAWSLLRYAADRDPTPDAQFFRALIDAPATGLANLNAALAQDAIPWMHDWAVSVFADDLVPQIDARYRQPSWNHRDLIAALRVLDRSYPLRLLPLENGPGFSVTLRVGAAAYAVFSIPSGQRALISVRATDQGSANTLRSLIMRVN